MEGIFLRDALLVAKFNPTRAHNFPCSAESTKYDRCRFPVGFPSNPWPGVARVRTPPASGQAVFVRPSVGMRLLYSGLELTACFRFPHHFPEPVHSGWGVSKNLAWYAGLRSHQECPWGRA